MTRTALVVGAGGSLGVALCAELHARGFAVVAAARDTKGLSAELGASSAEIVELQLGTPDGIERVIASLPEIDVLVYNAGCLHLAPLLETTPEMFEESWRVNAFGGFLCARALAPGMLRRRRGCMVFVGATSSWRGGARTHAFSAGKQALRGLSQSLAKELGPEGIHVSHVVIDGKVWGARTLQRFPQASREQCLEPAAVASTIVFLVEQPRSAWTFELDLRPDVERWS